MPFVFSGFDLKGLDNQQKMQLKDNFFSFLTNVLFPILIYIKNDKLSQHVKNEFIYC